MTIIQNSVELINNHVGVSIKLQWFFNKKKQQQWNLPFIIINQNYELVVEVCGKWKKNTYPFFAIIQIQAIALAVYLMYVVVYPFSRIIYVPP